MSIVIKLIKSKSLSGENLWFYLLYMVIGCAITAGLNIVHTKYVLRLDLQLSFFIVPIIAGLIFGYITARVRNISNNAIATRCNFYIISKHITQACFVTGALNVVHTEWVLQKELTLELFIAPLIAGVFFGYLIAKIKILNNKLLRMANTDILTRTANRMQFDKCITEELDRVRKTGRTFSIIYFDIDNFKEINDAHGHLAGDHVLVEVAHSVKKTIGNNDTLARYGGDEFIILARNKGLQACLRLAENIKHSITLATDGMNIPVSCSFGVVEYTQQRDSLTSLIRDVDEAMYAAKNDGRNCVAAG